MGKSVSFKGISQEGHAANRPSTASSSSSAANGKDKIDPMLWGRPGHLTDVEAETFVSSTLYTASAVLGLEHFGRRSRYDPLCVMVAVHCVSAL